DSCTEGGSAAVGDRSAASVGIRGHERRANSGKKTAHGRDSIAGQSTLERIQLTTPAHPDGGYVNPDIAALLEVQTDDLAIHALERSIEQLMPKVNALNAECVKAEAAVNQAVQL